MRNVMLMIAISLLFIVLVSGCIDEQTVSSYSEPLMADLQISDFSDDGTAEVTAVIKLNPESIAIPKENENLRTEIILPEGVEIVEGSTVWEGRLNSDEAATMTITIRATEAGNKIIKVKFGESIIESKNIDVLESQAAPAAGGAEPDTNASAEDVCAPGYECWGRHTWFNECGGSGDYTVLECDDADSKKHCAKCRDDMPITMTLRATEYDSYVELIFATVDFDDLVSGYIEFSYPKEHYIASNVEMTGSASDFIVAVNYEPLGTLRSAFAGAVRASAGDFMKIKLNKTDDYNFSYNDLVFESITENREALEINNGRYPIDLRFLGLTDNEATYVVCSMLGEEYVCMNEEQYQTDCGTGSSLDDMKMCAENKYCAICKNEPVSCSSLGNKYTCGTLQQWALTCNESGEYVLMDAPCDEKNNYYCFTCAGDFEPCGQNYECGSINDYETLCEHGGEFELMDTACNQEGDEYCFFCNEEPPPANQTPNQTTTDCSTLGSSYSCMTLNNFTDVCNGIGTFLQSISCGNGHCAKCSKGEPVITTVSADETDTQVMLTLSVIGFDQMLGFSAFFNYPENLYDPVDVELLNGVQGWLKAVNYDLPAELRIAIAGVNELPEGEFMRITLNKTGTHAFSHNELEWTHVLVNEEPTELFAVSDYAECSALYGNDYTCMSDEEWLSQCNGKGHLKYNLAACGANKHCGMCS